MTPSLQVVEAANAFWREANLPVAFPRDLRRAIALTLPVSIVLLPELQVTQVQAWLLRQGRSVDVPATNRPLQACLIAHHGIGVIFVDGGDQECEQRFSIAHELAHFLLDYLAPRQEAVARLGEGILEVLDGLRPARIEERAVALLTGVHATTHVHLMGRAEEEDAALAIDAAEARADALALELLTPWADVSMQIGEQGSGRERHEIERLLIYRHGLPPGPARRYAAQFVPWRESTSPLLHYLRNVPCGASSPMPQVASGSSGGRRQ